ncbi:trypsin-like peptidase domain-containing protein [Streptomyces sp. NPDC006660]|uniref:S1C family serine protease n=1 Tax=Streptomyces sp. NPDC006660 TaxID=3156901 RepID=UPI0033D8CFF3
MNQQKPTGPRPKWWSRPQAGRPEGSEPPVTPNPAEPPADTYDLAPPTPAPPADSAPAPSSEPHHASSMDPAPAAGPEPTGVDATDGTGADARTTESAPATTDIAPATGSALATTDSAPATTGSAPPATTTAPAPGSSSGAPAEASPAGQTSGAERQGPLHAPDPYGTPPYGGPGPWAPAPPVQRPVPTPPGGTALPPQPAYAAPQPPAPPPAYGVPPQAAQTPPQPPAPQLPPPHQPPATPAPLLPAEPQWAQYDPWSGPGAASGAAGGPGQPGPRKRRRGALLVGALLLALVAGGIGGGVGAYVERNGGITSVHLPQAGKEPGGRAPDSVAGIAASALPSVVTIHVTGVTESGTGTGFVLDSVGHILTNNHVVQPAGTSGKISVTFSGGESAAGTVVGRDTGYDLAVVKVDGVSGMKPLPLGNSDNVMVGDPVVAIGAPFDLSNTVTSGIISAKERPITAGGEAGDGSDVSYVDALQTDAPINPGNSGGPLVDSKARVIGINSAIRSVGGGSKEGGGQAGSIGLGFAIPVNQAKRVAEELINTGRATHPVIGVTLDMKYTGDGARVGDKASDGKPAVVPGGPGDKAGVASGDVITKVDGQRVHSAEELIVKIRAHRPGDRLGLTVRRDGKERELTLTLGSAS